MCTFTYPYKTDYTIVTSFCPRWALVAARMLQRPSTGYVKSISDLSRFVFAALTKETL